MEMWMRDEAGGKIVTFNADSETEYRQVCTFDFDTFHDFTYRHLSVHLWFMLCLLSREVSLCFLYRDFTSINKCLCFQLQLWLVWSRSLQTL